MTLKPKYYKISGTMKKQVSAMINGSIYKKLIEVAHSKNMFVYELVEAIIKKESLSNFEEIPARKYSEKHSIRNTLLLIFKN